MAKKVVVGLLGAVLDLGKRNRWEKWRPSVSICQHEDLLVHRFHLLYQEKFQGLAERVIKDIQTVSPETEVAPENIEFEDPWDFEEVYSALLDYAEAYPFDPEQEEYLVHITTGTHVAQICMFLLTEAGYLPAKLLQTSPPKRHNSDSSGSYTIIDLDLSKYDRIASRFQRDFEEATSFLKSGIETRNAQFNALIDHIERVAMRSEAPVLLTGQTGAGKSQLARRIYELKVSKRQVKGPFIEVNCATLRGDGAMSALFGHKKGAFTGAASDRPGLLMAADGGMLFLDEIGDLGLDEQAMLLRAIEEKRFLPMGSDIEQTSDFQLIAGTNRDLKDAASKGEFREDLLARIDLWTFRLPGLAQRREDIEPNLDYEQRQFAKKTGRQVRFNKEARSRFLKFATSPEAKWSANFRDLNAAFTRMATLAPSGRITVECADEEIERLRVAWEYKDDTRSPPSLEEVLLPEKLHDLDRFDAVQLAEVVRVCRESRSLSESGRKLFSSSRKNRKQPNDADRLRKYLARFGLDWKKIMK